MVNQKTGDTSYKYTKLCDILEPHSNLNIYGVVTTILKRNGRTRKGGFHSVIEINDDSVPSYKRFKMHLFDSKHRDVLNKIEVGSIVRFHRVKVEKSDKQEKVLDGRVFRVTDIVVFPVEPSTEYFSAAGTLTLTDEDLRRVSELRGWNEMLYAPLDESCFTETASQRIVLRTSPKRKETAENVEKPSPEAVKITEDESSYSNTVVINPACGKNRIINPSMFKPHKVVLINPFNADFEPATGRATSSKDSPKDVINEPPEETKGKKSSAQKSTKVDKVADNSSPTSNSIRRSPRKVNENMGEQCLESVRPSKGNDCEIKINKTVQGGSPAKKKCASDGVEELDGHSPRILTSQDNHQKRLELACGSTVTVEEETGLSDGWLRNSGKKNCAQGRWKRKQAKVEVMSLLKKKRIGSPGEDLLEEETNCLPTKANSSHQVLSSNDTCLGTNENDSEERPSKSRNETVPESHQSHSSKENAELYAKDASSNSKSKKRKASSQCRINVAFDEVNEAAEEVQANEDTFLSVNCPGLSCIGIDCKQPGPVLLEDDDPRLADVDEYELDVDGLGDIPAANEDGQSIFRQKNLMPYGDGGKATHVTAESLMNFSWPLTRSKVKITKIKPSLTVLSSGPKDLISGKCRQCLMYSIYSKLKWKKDHVNGTKKPVCPVCFEDGKCHYVSLEFRIKLFAKDAWGTELQFYATKRHASKLISCSVKEYQESEDCRCRVTKLLSDIISSKIYFNVILFRALTLPKAQFYICNTALADFVSSRTS